MTYADEVRWYEQAMASAKSQEERSLIHAAWEVRREAERPTIMPRRIQYSNREINIAYEHPKNCQCSPPCQLMHDPPPKGEEAGK